MNQSKQTFGKQLKSFFYAGIIFVGLGLFPGCADIPVGVGLAALGGVSYYAFQSVHEKDVDEKDVAEKDVVNSEDVEDKQLPSETEE